MCTPTNFVKKRITFDFNFAGSKEAKHDVSSILGTIFNPDEKSLDILLDLTFDIFERNKVLSVFDISEQVFRAFLRKICDGYLKTLQYHNFKHAFYVTWFAYRALRCEVALSRTLVDIDILALLLACVCHDYNHPGVTNQYLIKIESPIAKKYPVSPTETNTFFAAWECIEESKILHLLSTSDVRRVKEVMHDLIISSDILNEQQRITNKESWDKVMSFVEAKNSEYTPSDLVPDWTLAVMRQLLLVSDIGATTDVWGSCAYPWATHLYEELHSASKLHEDQEPLTARQFLSSQDKFLRLYALPLFESAVAIFPSFVIAVKRLKENTRKTKHVTDEGFLEYLAKHKCSGGC